ncbi:MAG TPA: EpsI family protein, partial [Phycisphaerae bacterium]|nr:EpsI family protein [Phycisphaerae bacterium]
DILGTNDARYCKYYSPTGSEPLVLAIIFSKDNRKGIHPPDLCLVGSGNSILSKDTVVISGFENREDVICRELVVQHSSGSKPQYYLYTYKSGKQYTPSFWSQQWTIFINGILDRNASGALIQVSTQINSNQAQARSKCMDLMKAVIPHLDSKLP